MAWRNGGSKFKNSLNSNSEVVVLQVIKFTELPFPLFFNSSVIPWSFRVSPLYSVFLLSYLDILNGLLAVASLSTGACWLPEWSNRTCCLSGHCRSDALPGGCVQPPGQKFYSTFYKVFKITDTFTVALGWNCSIKSEAVNEGEQALIT